MRTKQVSGAALIEAVLLLSLIAAIGVVAFRQTGHRVGCNFAKTGHVVGYGLGQGAQCQGDPDYCALLITNCLAAEGG